MNRRIELASRPDGTPGADDFVLTTESDVDPREGTAVVEVLYVSIDPGMRSALRDVANPRFRVGAPVLGWGLARVLESRTPAFRAGQIVRGRLPWATRALIDADTAPLDIVDTQHDIPLSAELGALGLPGLVAYVGMLDIGQPRPSDVVMVSSAAGAVGSVAGQIARIHGCTVIGSTRAEKIDRVRDLGFNEVFDYRLDDPLTTLRGVAPQGIDVYFDNVGGAQLQAAFDSLRPHGRIVCCGSTSLYDDPAAESFALRGLRGFVTRRLTMSGFTIWDHLDRASAHRTDMLGWIRGGMLRDTSTVIEGFERIPETFVAMLQGAYTGKVMVRVA